MSDERLILITDSSGTSLKRWSVSMRTIRRLVITLGILVLATLSALAHSVVLHSASTESRVLQEQNIELVQLLEQRRAERKDLLAVEWKLTAIKERLWEESNLDTDLPLEAYLTQLNLTNHEDIETVRPLAELERDFLLYERQAFRTLSHFKNTQMLLGNTPSLRPARSPWITSRFGPRRDPVSGKPAMHKGLDLGGYTGMPIIAPADGKGVNAGMRGGLGITVVLDHGYGVQNHFGQLSALHVEYGQNVRRGSIIGEMGNTGKSTGTHLHYEVRRWGLPLNPELFMLD